MALDGVTRGGPGWRGPGRCDVPEWWCGPGWRGPGVVWPCEVWGGPGGVGWPSIAWSGWYSVARGGVVWPGWYCGPGRCGVALGVVVCPGEVWCGPV